MSAHSRWPLVVASGATALLLLDVTVVYLASPSIGAGLDATFTELQWVVDAYALTMAAVLLLTGALADRFGRRRVFLAGLLLFALASVGCATAQSAVALDFARAVQGLGAAGLFSTSLALIGASYQGHERGVALGIWGAVSGAALAAGPVVGGVIVEGLDWRWIFWINVPAAAALALAAVARVSESRGPAKASLDWLGAVYLGGFLLLLVGALLQGNERGWNSVEIVASLGASVAFLVAFVARELGAEQPLLDLRLFRDRSFSATAVVTLLQSIAIYPVLLFFALELQGVFGFDALEAGLRVLPVTGALLLVAPIAGRLTHRLPLGWLLAAGLAVTAAGLALGSATEVEDGWSALLPSFIVLGLGLGVLSPALAAAILGSLAADEGGLASGIGNTFRQAGIAVGIALFGVVFQGATPDDPALGTLLQGGEVAAAATARAFHDGLESVLVVAAAIAAAGAVVALAVRPAPATARGPNLRADGGGTASTETG